MEPKGHYLRMSLARSLVGTSCLEKGIKDILLKAQAAALLSDNENGVDNDQRMTFLKQKFKYANCFAKFTAICFAATFIAQAFSDQEIIELTIIHETPAMVAYKEIQEEIEEYEMEAYLNGEEYPNIPSGLLKRLGEATKILRNVFCQPLMIKWQNEASSIEKKIENRFLTDDLLMLYSPQGNHNGLLKDIIRISFPSKKTYLNVL